MTEYLRKGKDGGEVWQGAVEERLALGCLACVMRIVVEHEALDSVAFGPASPRPCSWV